MASCNNRTRGFVRGTRPPRVYRRITLVKVHDYTRMAYGGLKERVPDTADWYMRKRARTRYMELNIVQPDATLGAIVHRLNLELRRGLLLRDCAGLLALCDWARERGSERLVADLERIAATHDEKLPASLDRPKRRRAPRPRPQ